MFRIAYFIICVAKKLKIQIFYQSHCITNILHEFTNPRFYSFYIMASIKELEKKLVELNHMRTNAYYARDELANKLGFSFVETHSDVWNSTVASIDEQNKNINEIVRQRNECINAIRMLHTKQSQQQPQQQQPQQPLQKTQPPQPQQPQHATIKKLRN